MKNTFFILLLFSPLFLFGQIFTNSNLPIVVINTNGQIIQDDPRIICDMGIIDNGFGNMNSINDSYNDYNGRISIEIRGSSSQQHPKKSYGLETQDSVGNNNNVSLLGMPVENDWVLYAPYPDKTMIRNVFTYKTFEKMGYWSPRTRYCELLINGDYLGVYVLLEKIKRDSDRLDIKKLTSADTIGDDLTGGYIMKVDKGTGSGTSSIVSAYDPRVIFRYHDPGDDELLQVQKDYIEQYIRDFEDALEGPNFNDDVLGYKRFIDRASFIDFWLMQELGRTVDGFRSSSFFYKDKDSQGGKLMMGPMWDFNLSYGNADYCDAYSISGWQKDFNVECPSFTTQVPFWWNKLLQDTIYKNEARCRWEELRENILATTTITNFIDSTVFVLQESRERNFVKWPIIGLYVNGNYFVGSTYVEDVNHFKTWIIDRANWMDGNIPGTCNPSTIEEHPTNKELLKVTDLLGRETKGTKNALLFYIYDDGTVEKKIIID